MKAVWRGPYRGGEVVIEAEDVEVLNKQLDSVFKYVSTWESLESVAPQASVPRLSGNLGCSDAVRKILGTPWGREPRTMTELKQAFETNALYFSDGTLSGVLNHLTKSSVVRRVNQGGKWRYILSAGG